MAKVSDKKKQTKYPYWKATAASYPLLLANMAVSYPVLRPHVKGLLAGEKGNITPEHVTLLKQAKAAGIHVKMTHGKSNTNPLKDLSKLFQAIGEGTLGEGDNKFTFNKESFEKALNPGLAGLEKTRRGPAKGKVGKILATLRAQRPFLQASAHSGPEFLAHEMGHIPQMTRFGKTGMYRRGLAAGAGNIGNAVSAAGTFFKGRSEKGSKEYKVADAVSKGGLAVSAAGGAKILADEVGASARGLNYMRKAGMGRRVMLKGAGNLGLALGTYVGALGTPLAASYLYRKYKERQRPMKERTLHKVGAFIRREKP